MLRRQALDLVIAGVTPNEEGIYCIDNARLRMDPDGIIHQWFEPPGGTFASETLEASRELVLRCGKASITLRSDGIVQIHGRDITSWARRRQRIRGGSGQHQLGRVSPTRVQLRAVGADPVEDAAAHDARALVEAIREVV